MSRAKWPNEWLGFKDKEDGELYEAVGFRMNCIGETTGFVMRFLNRHGGEIYHAPNNWIATEWVIPLTAAARDFLAIAKERR